MQRDDDREEVVRERLQAYDQQTLPVLDFFGSGIRYRDGRSGRAATAPREELTAQIREAPEAGMIVRKNMAELEKMRRSGLLVWKILGQAAGDGGRGRLDLDLEVTAEKMMQRRGREAGLQGLLRAGRGNEVPVCAVYVGERRDRARNAVAEEGFEERAISSRSTPASQLNGYYGDSAITVPVGEVSPEVEKLMEVTRESLELAIEKVRPGNRLFDICGTVERHVTANGFSVVREFVGHGIGTQMHEEPQIPNYVDRRERESAVERRHGAGDRADGECRQAGDRSAARQVDRGDRGRKVLGALRAYGGGHGERPVGSDQAVSGHDRVEAKW